MQILGAFGDDGVDQGQRQTGEMVAADADAIAGTDPARQVRKIEHLRSVSGHGSYDAARAFSARSRARLALASANSRTRRWASSV